jgi:hypothetical protein
MAKSKVPRGGKKRAGKKVPQKPSKPVEEKHLPPRRKASAKNAPRPKAPLGGGVVKKKTTPVKKTRAKKPSKAKPVKPVKVEVKKPKLAKKPKSVKPPVKPVKKASGKVKRKLKKLLEKPKSKARSAPENLTGLASTYAEIVKLQLEKMLARAKAKFGGATFVFHLRNNTVDALWRIPCKREDDLIQKALRIEHAVKDEILDRRVWISCGVVFPDNKPIGDYHKWQGLNTAMAYFQHWLRQPDKTGKMAGGVHENFATLRGIVKNMKKAKRRKAQFFVIKWHWNVGDIKPDRDEA